MKNEDFFDFASLGKGPFMIKKVNENGEKFLRQQTNWFRYEEIGVALNKTSLAEEQHLRN